jgi:hypothetical protein
MRLRYWSDRPCVQREVSIWVSIRGYTRGRRPSRGGARVGDLRLRVEQLKVLSEAVLVVIRCRSSRQWGLGKPCLLGIRGERRGGRLGNGCR